MFCMWRTPFSLHPSFNITHISLFFFHLFGNDFLFLAYIKLLFPIYNTHFTLIYFRLLLLSLFLFVFRTSSAKVSPEIVSRLLVGRLDSWDRFDWCVRAPLPIPFLYRCGRVCVIHLRLIRLNRFSHRFEFGKICHVNVSSHSSSTYFPFLSCRFTRNILFYFDIDVCLFYKMDILFDDYYRSFGLLHVQRLCKLIREV